LHDHTREETSQKCYFRKSRSTNERGKKEENRAITRAKRRDPRLFRF